MVKGWGPGGPWSPGQLEDYGREDGTLSVRPVILLPDLSLPKLFSGQEEEDLRQDLS
jgi:hypothetical protein